jgi:PAS domain S-box-containing protein
MSRVPSEPIPGPPRIDVSSEHEASYRLLFAYNPTPMWFVDDESFAFLEVNAAAIRDYGYTRDEFLQMTIQDIRPPEDVAPMLAYYERSLTEHHHEPLGRAGLWRHRTKNGSLLTVDISWSAVLFRGREARLIVAHDVTEQERAKAEAEHRAHAAEEAQHLLQTLLEHVPEGISIAAGPPDFPIIAHSRYALELFGRPQPSLLGLPAGHHVRAHGLFLADGVTRPTPGQMPLYRASHLGETVTNEEWVIERPDAEKLAVLVNVVPIRDNDGRIIGAINCWRDITARKRIEEELAGLRDELATNLQSLIRLHEVSTRFVHNGDTPEFLEQVIETAMAITGTDLGNIQLLNPQSGMLDIIAQRGFANDFLTFFSRMHIGHAACGTAMEHKQRIVVEDISTDLIFQGSPAREVLLAAGARAVQSTPLLTRAGAVLGMLSTHFRTPHRPSGYELRLIDLCARQAADLIEAKRVEQKLTVSLHEKEVLLKEIHHRVKNNLQIICSLQSLQSKTIHDPALQELFHESERRIRAMALIHETLYQTADLSRFDVVHYLRTLSTQLVQSYGASARHITLRTHVENIPLSLDTAIPCGLVLNELFSNALKHAFPNGQRGDITLTFAAVPEGYATLRVQDTGVGFPEGLDFRHTESLGLQLVCALSEQLQGTLTLARHGGTIFTLTFPLSSTQGSSTTPSAGAQPLA